MNMCLKFLDKLINIFYHDCDFKYRCQKEYEIAYTDKWIIYNLFVCKCGQVSIVKLCGTLDCKDVPLWSIENN